MGIVVKEINIKVSVSEETPTGKGGGTQLSAQKEDQIVAKCIEQVFQILEDKKER